MADLTTLQAVKAQVGITDSSDDLWIAGAITAVSNGIEAFTERWLAPRPSATFLLDATDVGREQASVTVAKGLASVSYVGVSWVDQPDDGSGLYTPIALQYVYLDPPALLRQEGAPAFRLSLSRYAGIWFPSRDAWIRRCIKITGNWGYATTPARVGQIAANTVSRSYRARASGGADLAVVDPTGAMKILRDQSPAEFSELQATWRDMPAG